MSINNFKKNLFFKFKNKINNVIIYFFFLILTSNTLAQSNSIISCNETNNIKQFKASLILHANESNILNINGLKNYLDKQILEKNSFVIENSTKNLIKTSLMSAETYNELSKIYSIKINKYDYYEFFTSKIFCEQIEHLESLELSNIQTTANDFLQKKLLEKLIIPYNDKNLLSKNTQFLNSEGETKKSKNINKDLPIILFPFILDNYPDYTTVTKWASGVNLSTYNTSTYNTVRASEDWTDLNDNFDGENSDLDFRYENNPVHPYETLGADDAYAYGFTGKGQVIAIHDSDFCAVPHVEVKTKYNEGRITSYNYEDWNWCDSNGFHGVAVFGFATAEFHNDSTNHEDSLMGVAYNADLHLSDYYGDGEQHWNPSRWAENLDHGKNSGAVVQNNSWGFDDDLNPDVIKNYMDNNNKTLAEALVYYQGIKTEGLTGDDDRYDIGIGTTQVDWTTNDWNTFFDSINSFQETGVYVNAGSNDTYGNMGIVNCTEDIDGNKQCHSNPTITIDTSGGLPYLLPSLRDAWIQVVNVLNYGTDSGKKQMWSAPCGQMGEWCVSGDAVHVPYVGYTLSGGADDIYFYEGFGTSYAAPMISGAVAIMAEAFPNLTPSEWTQRLFATANNNWFNNTNCYDWSKVTDSSLVSKNDVGKSQDDSYFTASCGGIDGYATYGDGVTHGYNQIYGHGYPDLKKALEPIGHNKIKVGGSAYPLIGTSLLLGLTYMDFSYKGTEGQFHDSMYTGFNFKMDSIVKQSVRSNPQVLNSSNVSSRKQWIDSIGTENTQLNYALEYNEEENKFDQINNKSPEIASLSFSYNNQENMLTNANYKKSSNSLLGFNVGERPLQRFLSNGVQQEYLPFTTAMENGYSIDHHLYFNDKNKMIFNFYQGEHSFTKKMESGFLLNYSNFHLKEDSYLNAYAGFNSEDDSFLRNQTSGAFGKTNASTYHTGFSYENSLKKNLYFGSNINFGHTTTTIDKETLISSIDALITSQYVIGLVKKNFTNKKDSISFNLSQPLSVENGKATVKIPYYLNKSSNGFSEKEIDISIKDRFNKLNLDYVYNFSKNNQLHAGINLGMINFNKLDSPSFLFTYQLSF